MNRFRTPARVTAAAAIAGAGVLALAAPATAASSDSVTINNSTHLTIKTSQPLHVAATAHATCLVSLNGKRTVSLTLTGPTGPDPSSTNIATASKPCSQKVSLDPTINAPKLNGSYTLTLQNGSNTNTTTASLDVLIPPAQTRSVAVTTAGTIATFTWTANSEADVTSYQVLDSSGSAIATVAKSDACGSGTSCAVKLDMGPSAAGQTETFSVRAVRCGLDCGGNTVDGPRSATVTAHFASYAVHTPPPTSSSPGSGGSGGGGTGGGSGGGGSGTGGSGSGGGGSGDGSGSGGGGASTSPPEPSSPTPGVSPSASPSAVSPTSASPAPSSQPTSPAPSSQQTTEQAGSPGQSGGATQSASSSSDGGASKTVWKSIAAVVLVLLLGLQIRAWSTRPRH